MHLQQHPLWEAHNARSPATSRPDQPTWQVGRPGAGSQQAAAGVLAGWRAPGESSVVNIPPFQPSQQGRHPAQQQRPSDA